MNKHNLKLIILGLITIVALSALGWGLKYEDEFSMPDIVSSEEVENTKTPLERGWEKYLKDLKMSSDMSVYIQYENDKFIWNNHRMRASSMIKPFIMADVFNEVKEGRLDLEQTLTMKASDKVGGPGRLTGYPSGMTLTLRQVVRAMIAGGDNTATNMLIDLLGMDQINKYLAENGYSKTVLQRKMMDFDSAQIGQENYTTAKNLGTLFARINDGKCVDEKYDREMLYILFQQESRVVLGTALKEKRLAHMVSEWDGLIYDGGIVYDENLENPYILVILNDNYKNRTDALDLNWKIARKLDQLTEEYQNR